MGAFRILLATLFVVLLGYTAMVIMDHGGDLFTVFFGAIVDVNWAGQFNLDFAAYLLLSALWIAWRHEFSPGALAFSGLAAVGGLLVFAPYVLFQAHRTQGNIEALLLGDARARRAHAGHG